MDSPFSFCQRKLVCNTNDVFLVVLAKKLAGNVEKVENHFAILIGRYTSNFITGTCDIIRFLKARYIKIDCLAAKGKVLITLK